MTQGATQGTSPGMTPGARLRHSFLEGMDNQDGDLLEQLAHAGQPKKSQQVDILSLASDESGA